MVSHFTGTITTAPLISLCRITFQKHSNVFNTHLRHNPNMLLTNVPHPIWQHGTTGSSQQDLSGAFPPLSPDKIKHIQQIVGTLLYFSQAVDPTLAAALSTIASQQSNGTKAVLDALVWTTWLLIQMPRYVTVPVT